MDIIWTWHSKKDSSDLSLALIQYVSSFCHTYNMIYVTFQFMYLRLQAYAYDRNKNVCQEPILLPELMDINWPLNHKDGLPTITREQIDLYFLYRFAGKCLG